MVVDELDIQALAGAKDGIVDALNSVGLQAQRAARTAKRLDLRETFGDEAALMEQIEAALPGIAKLEQQRQQLVASIGTLQAGLAQIEGALSRVAAEYQPPVEEVEA